MDGLPLILYIAMFAAVIMSTMLSIVSDGRNRQETAGFALVVVGLVSATILSAIRWVQSGHPPIFGTFENTLAAAWSLMAFSVACRRGSLLSRGIWRYSVPWALVLLIWGARYPNQPIPLTISERSLWVDIHVVFAWVAFVPLLVVGTMSAYSLLRKRVMDTRVPLPDEAFLQKMLAWGFIGFTGMLLTGAWYLNVLFGTLWQWGVVETLSLVAWVLYGIILHRMLWRRWRGSQLHWALALTVPVLLLVFFVWSVFPGTFHFFDIPLVRPY